MGDGRAMIRGRLGGLGGVFGVRVPDRPFQAPGHEFGLMVVRAVEGPFQLDHLHRPRGDRVDRPGHRLPQILVPRGQDRRGSPGHPLANASSIFTQSGKAARRFKYDVEASMAAVNIGVAAPMSFFGFGGAKGSFFGDLKAHGREAFDFYTDRKVLMSRWD